MQEAAIQAGVGAYDVHMARTKRYMRPAHEQAREQEALCAAGDAMRAVVVDSWPSRQGGGRGQHGTNEPGEPEEPEQLAAIEVERKQNIARNHEILCQLGLA